MNKCSNKLLASKIETVFKAKLNWIYSPENIKYNILKRKKIPSHLPIKSC